MITFEVCDCGATHKHGYFYEGGERVSPAIYSTPKGQEFLAGIHEDTTAAKAQLEAAGLSPEVLEHERQMAAMPPEMIELLAFLERLGGRVVVVR
jgi:hypothetical protein